MQKLHAIVPFKCGLSGATETAAIWFCSNFCRAIYVDNITGIGAALGGSLAFRFFALEANKKNCCAKCEERSL